MTKFLWNCACGATMEHDDRGGYIPGGGDDLFFYPGCEVCGAKIFAKLSVRTERDAPVERVIDPLEPNLQTELDLLRLFFKHSEEIRVTHENDPGLRDLLRLLNEDRKHCLSIMERNGSYYEKGCSKCGRK